jgi:integrase
MRTAPSSALRGSTLVGEPVTHGKAEELRDAIALGLWPRSPFLEISERGRLGLDQPIQGQALRLYWNSDRGVVRQTMVGRRRKGHRISSSQAAGTAPRWRKLQGNPVVPIRSPRLRDVEHLFNRDIIKRVISSQPELRDRVALKLLFLIGIRKASPAQLRLKDFDLGRQLLGPGDIGTTANIYVQPNDASLERELSDICGNGGADNGSARPG